MTSIPKAVLPYDPFLDDVTTTDLPYFNVLDYGAFGNGSTDDVTAIQAAIDAAYAAGGIKAIVWVPNGTFIIGAALNVKCQMYGSGTIKSKTGNAINGTVTIPTTYDGAGIYGIAVDGNLTGNSEANYAGTYGIIVNANNVTIERVRVRNTLGPAIYVGYTNAARLAGVRIINNDLKTARSKEASLYFGDGVQTQWTDGIVVRDNVIDDIMRIGVVLEGDGTLKSIRSNVNGNTISNASGAGSSGQKNAGVWVENTLSATISSNTCTSTGSGVILGPTNGTAEAEITCRDNKIYGVSGSTARAYDVGIAGAKSRISIIGGSISGATASSSSQAILISTFAGDILIEGVHFGAYTFPNNNNAALIGVNVTGNPDPVRSLTIKNCTKETSTYVHNDSADINLISTGGLSGNLQSLHIIDNPGSWSMLTQEAATLVRVRNTVLTHSAGAVAILNATTIGYELLGKRIYATTAGNTINPATTDMEILVQGSGGAGTIHVAAPSNVPQGRKLVIKDYAGWCDGSHIIDISGVTIEGVTKQITTAYGSLKIENVDGNWQLMP